MAVVQNLPVGHKEIHNQVAEADIRLEEAGMRVEGLRMAVHNLLVGVDTPVEDPVEEPRIQAVEAHIQLAGVRILAERLVDIRICQYNHL